MNNTITSAMSPKAGLCPHGLPPSACPICSNMGGGGSKRSEINFKSSPLPMMSWNQCEAIGYFLKAQKRASEKQRINFKLLTLQLQMLNDKMGHLIRRLEIFAQSISNLPLGNIINLPLNILIIKPLQIINTTFSKLINIAEKIASLIGEMLEGLKKAHQKIKEFITEAKNKFFKLFEIFKPNNEKDTDKDIREEKKIFNLKKFIKKLKRNRQKEQ